MLEKQGHACAICERKFEDCQKRGPHADHDHRTGKVRDLLCGECNNGLGKFREEPALFYKAVEYLKRHQERLESQVVS